MLPDAFATLSKIWKYNDLNKKIMLRLLCAIVFSMLLYGISTKKVTPTIIRKLQAFVNIGGSNELYT